MKLTETQKELRIYVETMTYINHIVHNSTYEKCGCYSAIGQKVRKQIRKFEIKLRKLKTPKGK